jgi:anaerobic ribonucleoside-triphosphate reductase activating protein
VGTDFLPVEKIAADLKSWLDKADGLTVSGGEPFEQAEGLRALVRMVRQQGWAGDILTYTGFPKAKIDACFPWAAAELDVLITEPYDASAGQTLIWRGSDNQRVWLLSDLARSRFPADVDSQRWPPGPRLLDLVVESENVWMAGIPKPGGLGLAGLRQNLAVRGFTCTTSNHSGTIVRA